VHVNAVGAAIDLRGAHLHKMDEFVIQTAFAKILFEREQGFQPFLRVFTRVNSWFHGNPFSGERAEGFTLDG
jgi:hypothetical protein